MNEIRIRPAENGHIVSVSSEDGGYRSKDHIASSPDEAMKIAGKAMMKTGKKMSMKLGGAIPGDSAKTLKAKNPLKKQMYKR